MSKKKGRTASKTASKQASKKASSTQARTRVAAAPRAARPAAEASAIIEHTAQITIFLFRTGSGNKIRTAPQRAHAGPGSIEWTIVNMIDGTDTPVRITWEAGSPFKEMDIRSRHTEPVPSGVSGTFKYSVHAFDTREDPEVEIPGI